jgi:L-alanine-DL-glutamate epimerase-like enolase superfamily enzyme
MRIAGIRASGHAFPVRLPFIDRPLAPRRIVVAGPSVARPPGDARGACEADATFGFPVYDEGQLVAAAEAQFAEGVRALKMVVGTTPGGWQQDARRVRRVRRAVGSAIALTIDANACLSPVAARDLARPVAEHRIAWFEQPVAANDARAMAELHRSIAIPVAAGPIEGHRFHFRALMEHQAVDAPQPKVASCGGFTELRLIAHVTEAFTVPLDNGGGCPLHNLHAVAGLGNGGVVEFPLDMRAIGEACRRARRHRRTAWSPCRRPRASASRRGPRSWPRRASHDRGPHPITGRIRQ